MMMRERRRVFVIILALAVSTEPVLADRWECYVIRAGDTAAQVAVHLTGNAANRHRPWFQIADPTASAFVAKTNYDDIRPGWAACILRQSLTATASDSRSSAAGMTNGTAKALSLVADTLAAIPNRLGGLALLFAATLLLWYIADQYWNDRQATIARLTRFGEAFIREFERPLVQPRSSDRALQSRMRLQPDRACLEVLLAPSGGRRYPNLTDHRRNVEYDVARVLEVLGGQSFATGPLHQQGPWVVIPFEFKNRQQQAGVT
jgi:hypothetical protein